MNIHVKKTRAEAESYLNYYKQSQVLESHRLLNGFHSSL